jgi:hypothetical protein
MADIICREVFIQINEVLPVNISLRKKVLIWVAKGTIDVIAMHYVKNLVSFEIPEKCHKSSTCDDK